MARFNLHNWVERRLPTRLQDGLARELIFGLASMFDAACDAAVWAVMARHVTEAPRDALALLGADRTLVRGPTETDAQWRLRLQDAWTAWQNAGSKVGLLSQINVVIPQYVTSDIIEDYWYFTLVLTPSDHVWTAADTVTLDRIVQMFRPAHVVDRNAVIELTGRAWRNSATTRLIDENLIADGDMERDNVTSWTASSSTLSKVVTTRDGNTTRVLRVTATSSSDAWAAQYGLQEGVQYRVRGYYNTAGSSGASPMIYDGYYYAGDFSNEPRTWKAFDITFTATDTGMIAFGLQDASNTRYIDWDDITVTYADTTSRWGYGWPSPTWSDNCGVYLWRATDGIL